jgi:NADH-quinone oxidoreductase subunit F
MSAVAELVVGLGSCGIAAGAHQVQESLLQELAARGLKVPVTATGCIGACHREPLLEVREEGGASYLYGDLDAEKARRVVAEHLLEGRPVAEWLIPRDYPYLALQKKIVLANCGLIDPENIDDYLAVEGYQALRRVLSSMKPGEVIREVELSGLRGRGGAGFPTGTKWSLARAARGTKKYLICNADEGDPGAFMDRSLLESDPHAVLEGMAIAAFAIGCDEGYMYVRAEYPLAIKRLRVAIRQAEERGFLGSGILGTGFSFAIHLKEGAGAFVCGEETAMMASIEGQRGMPRVRPPFPAERGLWGAPTNINNVETFGNVPYIIRKGGAEYAKTGTARSKGTKVFALAGKIKHGGMIEVPMGISLREVIFKVGGGIRDDKRFKAVQLGGPSGGCIPESLLDVQVDYDSLTATGAIMGSGGMVVMDESTCMVDVARYFLSFTQNESCGKCTFCRMGTKRMLEVLERITAGQGRMSDLDLLGELAIKVKLASLCGLGQTAPNPVLTTLKYFRDEYVEHILRKRCPAKQCRALIRYAVLPEACTGCMACAKACPTQAAVGERKKAHAIIQEKCIKCGLCYQACRFEAIAISTGEPASAEALEGRGAEAPRGGKT